MVPKFMNIDNKVHIGIAAAQIAHVHKEAFENPPVPTTALDIDDGYGPHYSNRVEKTVMLSVQLIGFVWQQVS